MAALQALLLTEMYNSSSISPHMNLALISVHLKLNKDPTLCTSYQPTSLISEDIKAFVKFYLSIRKSNPYPNSHRSNWFYYKVDTPQTTVYST